MSNKERAFLHELMNLLTIADGNCRRLKRSLDTGDKENLESYLEKVQMSLSKMVTSAHLRREFLIENEEANIGQSKQDDLF